MPADGAWLMTIPAGTVALSDVLIVPTVRFACRMAVVAASFVKPTRLRAGTATGFATVTLTGAEVAVFPVGSRDTQVSTWPPLAANVVSQLIVASVIGVGTSAP